jgi:hypothetical protein
MRIRHIVALVANLAVAVIALTDAATAALTGHSSIFADDSEVLPAIVGSGLVHGVAYAATVWVLWQEAERFRSANGFARVVRWIVMISLAVLSVGFMVLQPVMLLTAVSPESGFAMAWGLIGTVAFAAFLLGAALLGLALIRRNPLGVGSRVLLGVLPAILLVVVLGIVAPAFAHPGVIELVAGVGLSVLGVPLAALARTPQAAPAEAVAR